MKTKISSLVAAVALLASCSQQMVDPTTMSGDRGLTTGIDISRHNVKMVCGRAYGESYGFRLLGLIPLKMESETEAVDLMYENARARGAAPEGHARQFVNNSIEKSTNYFILGSVPVIRAAGDLVEIYDGPAPRQAPAAGGKPAPQKKEGMSVSELLLPGVYRKALNLD